MFVVIVVQTALIVVFDVVVVENWVYSSINQSPYNSAVKSLNFVL